MVMVVDLVLWSPVSNLVSNGAPFWTVKNKQTKELFVVTKGFLKQMWPFLLAVMEWRLHSVTLPHLPRHVIARTKSHKVVIVSWFAVDPKINGSVGIPTLDDVDVFLNEIIDLRCGQLEDHYKYICIYRLLNIGTPWKWTVGLITISRFNPGSFLNVIWSSQVVILFLDPKHFNASTLPVFRVLTG